MTIGAHILGDSPASREAVALRGPGGLRTLKTHRPPHPPCSLNPHTTHVLAASPHRIVLPSAPCTSHLARSPFPACRHDVCFCDPGYEGRACEVATACGSSQCSTHGTCVHGRCFCDAGYGGDECATELTCPVADGRQCSGRGLCVLGACVCVSGVGGSACEQVYNTVVDARLRGASTAALRLLEQAHKAELHDGSTPMHRAAELRARRRALPNVAPNAAALASGRYAGGVAQADASGLPSRRLLFRLSPATRQQLLSGEFAADDDSPVDRHRGGGGGRARPLPPTGGQLRSATPAERAAGRLPSHVWPSASGGVTLLTHRGGSHAADAASDAQQQQPQQPPQQLSSRLPRAGVPSITSSAASTASALGSSLRLLASPAEASAVCLGDCSSNGQCAHAKCFCDPGWKGDDCASLSACPSGCGGHGACTHGLCYCDLGWSGVDCSELVPCPNDCGGHGTCHQARCMCDDGWAGADCTDLAPDDNKKGLLWWEVALIQLPVAFVGVCLGWLTKYAIDRRNRQRMRNILQAEAQRPFVSAPPSS